MSLSEGGGGTTKTHLSVSTPESKCHCECQREKQRDVSTGVREKRGCWGSLFGRARTGKTQVIREADAGAWGGLGRGAVPESSGGGKLGLFTFIC